MKLIIKIDDINLKKNGSVVLYLNICDKVFKNRLSDICGRQPLKIYERI